MISDEQFKELEKSINKIVEDLENELRKLEGDVPKDSQEYERIKLHEEVVRGKLELFRMLFADIKKEKEG